MKKKNNFKLARKSSQPIQMTFWTITPDGKIKINQHEMTKFLEAGGFRKTATKNGVSVVRVVNNIVSEAPDHEMIDYIKKYLMSIKELQVLEKFSTGVSSYINRGKHNLLKSIDIPIDKDPKDASWFYFRNTAVKVTKSKIDLMKYDNVPHYIWASRILDREYKPGNGNKSDFHAFLFNLARQDNDRFRALKSGIGYLLHRYQNPSLARAAIFVDENMSFTGKANGGTGKTLVTEAIGKMRELVGMDGKNIKTGNWFKNQRIERTTDVVRYDDVQRDFSLETLYSMITSGVPVERKYKDEFFISPENAPKIVVSSNYPVKGTGGSTDKRRRYEFEVANHYHANHQPIDEFQKHFFDDWIPDEWNDFDALMMDCVQAYLKNGLIEAKSLNLVKNTLVNNTCVEFVEYLEETIKIEERIDKRKYYQGFIEKYSIHKHVSSHQFTKWLKEFADSKNLGYSDRSAGGEYTFILTTKIEQDEK